MIGFDVCVLGLGPAGLGAMLELSRDGKCGKVIGIDAGHHADQRYCTIHERRGCRNANPCHIITGIGGSSVLSGGKISKYPAGRALEEIIGSKQETINLMESSFDRFNEFVPLIEPQISPRDIKEGEEKYEDMGFEFRYYDAYRYVNSDLIDGYGRMIREIESAHYTIRTGTRVVDIDKQGGKFILTIVDAQGTSKITANKIVYAFGRQGIDILKIFCDKMGLIPRPNRTDFGVRLEFPVNVWPEIDECHMDLKLHKGEWRTFCVNKEGIITPYRIGDLFLVEGHSEPGLTTGFSNFGISYRDVASSKDEYWLTFERRKNQIIQASRSKPIRQLVDDFLLNRPTEKRLKNRQPSSITYWEWGNINDCYEDGVSLQVRHAVDYYLKHLGLIDHKNQITVFGPEMDYYWPEIEVNSHFQTEVEDIFVVGDATGQFRGILQSFASGTRCAKALVE